MDRRLMGATLVLGTMLIFIALAMGFGYDLAIVASSSGAVAFVAAAVVQQMLGEDDNDGNGFLPKISRA
ncbi:hypothetical protein [Amycolatopsis sp. cmx-4-54]|uniref:hypothetical protein n=1 Tax=Amycolatopsis sp. cmx-4-54 TaxID=2790936 RepID=UPI00397A1C3D